MSEIALNPRGERSFVREMKLPAALLTRPLIVPPAKASATMSSTASGTRMSQVMGVTLTPRLPLISFAVSSSTLPRRPQIDLRAQHGRFVGHLPAKARAAPVTRMRLPFIRSLRNMDVMAFSQRALL